MSIRISGSVETEMDLRRISDRIVSDVVNPEFNLWATDIYKGFIKREHVWKGTMKSRTHVVNSSPERKEIRVDVNYAEKENQRKGNKIRGKGEGHGTPHQFVEPTLAEVNPKHFDDLVRKITVFIR